jgi:hypothetical protein
MAGGKTGRFATNVNLPFYDLAITGYQKMTIKGTVSGNGSDVPIRGTVVCQASHRVVVEGADGTKTFWKGWQTEAHRGEPSHPRQIAYSVVRSRAGFQWLQLR